MSAFDPKMIEAKGGGAATQRAGSAAASPHTSAKLRRRKADFVSGFR